jgi:hypothetical protein
MSERYKVAYTLRFPTERLAYLGPLCAAVNLEVLNTSCASGDAHMLVRMSPDDEAAVRDALECEPRYGSPAKVTRGVLVPVYTSPAEEIKARMARVGSAPTSPAPSKPVSP